MSRKICSIFNEVLGPIMVGPSSSHTAGPTRIGQFVRSLMGDEIESVTVTFDEKGSYPLTYRGQGSDRGFLSGLMGFETNDDRIRDAHRYAQKAFDYHFDFKDLEATHPNTAMVTAKVKGGRTHQVMSHSTGGGMFRIIKIDQFDVDSMGDFHELFIFISDDMECVENIQDLVNEQFAKHNSRLVKSHEGCLMQIKVDRIVETEFLKALDEVGGVNEVAYVKPVLVSPSRINVEIPFYNAEEAQRYGKEQGLEFWQLGLRYEMARSGLSEEELFAIMENVYNAMIKAAEAGISGDIEMKGYLKPAAHKMHEAEKGGLMLEGGLINTAIVWATAVMETNSAIGAIVAAPTAGSAGVIPGAIIGVGLKMGLPKEEILKAMFAAATVGIFIEHQATFAAEVAACQAENGSGSSMAAAGVIQLIGGTSDQSFKAAALALQNLLGLVCDPIAGMVDIPCINRNAVAASNSIISANMVVGGFDPYIPLDEVIQAMINVGREMPDSLKCTGGGGLCTTPTGIRLKGEFS